MLQLPMPSRNLGNLKFSFYHLTQYSLLVGCYKIIYLKHSMNVAWLTFMIKYHSISSLQQLK